MLQAKPQTPEELAEFMRRAQEAVAEGERAASGDDFDALRWSDNGAELVTTAGQRIRCRVTAETHDNYGPDGTAFVTEYEFYVPGSDDSARATIELRINN